MRTSTVTILLTDATTYLDEKSRVHDNRTPVEQAFRFAESKTICPWVIVSNFSEIRLYHRSGQLAFERFVIQELSDESVLRKFHYLFQSETTPNLERLYRASLEHTESIAKNFYRAYREVRRTVYGKICSLRPDASKPHVFDKTQLLLNRVLLICFCEDRHLMAKGLLRGIVARARNSSDQVGTQAWEEILALFDALNRGTKRVLRFHRGLFDEVPFFYTFKLPNETLKAFATIAKYNFRTELDVDILGQILEQSVSEIESLSADFAGFKVAGHARKRQQDGIFYTPPHITDHIVRATLGRKFEALKQQVGIFALQPLRTRDFAAIREHTQTPGIQSHINAWETYLEKVTEVRVLDPACGAGAFLSQAFDFLYNELQMVNDRLAELRGGQRSLFDVNERILTQNLFGVDKSSEAVTITQLSLWLKAADADSMLPSLDNNIVVGNSLVHDKQVDPCALVWEEYFPSIMSDGGFDVILGNPPYDVLAEKEVKKDLSALFNYIQQDPMLARAKGGKQNLYKLFICRSLTLLRSTGFMSLIVPMSLMGDLQARGVRELLFEKTTILRVDAFPQKDRASERVFADAKQSTMILTCRAGADEGHRFPVLIHPGKHIEAPYSEAVEVSSSEIRAFSSVSAIPTCTHVDWAIIRKVLSRRGYTHLGEVATQRQGEINETTHAHYLTSTANGHPILRGSNITRYCQRGASQGEEKFLELKNILNDRGSEGKVHDYNHRRIGFQRSSPQNNFRRLIAAPLPKNVHCFDTVSYVTDNACQIDLFALLGLLNSAFYEWWFRILSTNSKINKYQFDVLPFIVCAGERGGKHGRAAIQAKKYREAFGVLRKHTTTRSPGWSLELVAALAREIHKLEKARTLTRRSQRSQLRPKAASLQEILDDAVFCMFGVTKQHASQIRARLGEVHSFAEPSGIAEFSG